MEENQNTIESLFERVVEYGKTSLELVKLKVVDKITDLVSSLVPNSVVFILIMVFVLFLNLGLAFWLGEIIGKTYYGFFIVAGFYGIVGVIVHFFMHKKLKKITGNYLIKQILK
jgi:fatty acid desaturase